MHFAKDSRILHSYNEIIFSVKKNQRNQPYLRDLRFIYS